VVVEVVVVGAARAEDAASRREMAVVFIVIECVLGLDVVIVFVGFGLIVDEVEYTEEL
jgi:hypothetical protein